MNLESPGSVLILFNMFGAAVGAVLSTSLLSLPAISRNSVRWMGVLLLCVSAAMMCISLDHAGLLADSPFTFVEYLCGAAFGPIIHAYVLVAASRRRSGSFWIAAGLLGIGVLATGSIQVLMAYQIAFTSLSILVFRQRPAECDSDDAYWVARLLVAAVGLHLAQLVRLAVGSAQTPLREIVPLTATIGVIALCRLALRRNFEHRAETAANKYERSRLAEPDAVVLLRRLEGLMENGKLYRQPDLTLSVLAEAVGVTPHLLSQILNQYAGQTFSEYLNRLRVREVQQRLADSSNNHLTIEAIGQETGFKSRSALYAAFAKVAGMSPSQFRKKKMS